MMRRRDRSAATGVRCGDRNLTKSSRSCAVWASNLRHAVVGASFGLVEVAGEALGGLARARGAKGRQRAREREKVSREGRAVEDVLYAFYSGRE